MAVTLSAAVAPRLPGRADQFDGCLLTRAGFAAPSGVMSCHDRGRQTRPEPVCAACPDHAPGAQVLRPRTAPWLRPWSVKVQTIVPRLDTLQIPTLPSRQIGRTAMITTALTEMFGLQHPIVLGPMGGVSGGRLAAAVSNAGGLGLVGGGYGDPAWLNAELACVRDSTSAPWGVGLITWSCEPEILALALRYRPHAVLLSFGDPRLYAAAIHQAGCKLICQVQDLDGAALACEAGADLIVAQGTEAGGHGGLLATMPLVPTVVDAVAPIPVIAAGGIADGRGLAAALMLGAQGALIGTRFCATPEALGHDEGKQRIVAAQAGQTGRTRVFDIVRGYHWPTPYTGRALQNRFTRQWHGHEDALAGQLANEKAAYAAAAQAADFDTALVWAGEAAGLIHSVEPAANLVAQISAQAQAQLDKAGQWLRRGSA